MSKFQKYRVTDIASIIPLYELLVDCGISMHKLYNLMHWYPFMDLNKFITLMNNKELYGVYENSIPIATFNLSKTPREYYFENLWSNPDGNALYLGQLGIKPSYQGRGIGKWCMYQIEYLAYESDCKAIRFDGLYQHPWLKNFYQTLGYNFCGTIKPAEWELACFEKVLS